jgi:hypothetical protein
MTLSYIRRVPNWDVIEPLGPGRLPLRPLGAMPLLAPETPTP